MRVRSHRSDGTVEKASTNQGVHRDERVPITGPIECSFERSFRYVGDRWSGERKRARWSRNASVHRRPPFRRTRGNLFTVCEIRRIPASRGFVIVCDFPRGRVCNHEECENVRGWLTVDKNGSKSTTTTTCEYDPRLTRFSLRLYLFCFWNGRRVRIHW